MDVDVVNRAGQVLPELIDDLERLVRTEAPSADPDALSRSADLVTQIGERYLQAPAERIVRDDTPHLIWRLGQGPRRVLVLAHHDTVWPIGSWGAEPWQLADGVIRGPGCFDMLTGLMQALLALRLLREAGTSTDGVTLLVTGDEELGSLSSRQLIESQSSGCRAALILEASGPDGALKTERKGTSMYTVGISGRAAHAGLEPENGVNAGVELAHQVLSISRLGNPGLGTTVNPTVLSAGTTTNTIPAAASIEVDARARTVAEQQRIDADIRALTPTLPGATIRIGGGINRPPFEPSAANDLFDRAARVADAAGLGPLQAIGVGGGSDGNFTAAAGVPTLDGLGAVGGGAHADDEHVLVDQITPRAALLALLIDDLLADPA